MLSRRQMLALSTLGLLTPRALRSSSGSDRRFLFVFAPGGWDPALVFAPVESETIERGSIPYEFAEANGIPFVHGETRASVATFFETWGARTALVNGVAVRSIAHEVCLRLLMTGQPLPGADCWTSLVAAHADESLPMPAIHVLGPLYPVHYPGSTVRVGGAGQLQNLLSGSDLDGLRAAELRDALEALEEAHASQRLTRYAGRALGRGPQIAAAEEIARARAASLRANADTLALASLGTLAEQAAAVADCFELGLARAGMVACEGYADQGWDTHANNEFQDLHFETLFADLNTLLDDLAGRAGPAGGSLLDETTVVVLSEMGRNPTLNAAQGKEHWPWTAALLIGSGVAGGRAVGGWTETLDGQPVDLQSGEADDGGVTLEPAHLGATLLTLAGVDPALYLEDPAPITAVLA